MKNKGYMCDKHGKALVKLSAKKILRMVRKCGACLANFQTGREKLCEEHNDLYDAWETKTIKYYRAKCESCAAGAKK